MDAVLLTPHATAERLVLPDTGDAQHEALAARIGDVVEPAYYHRRAVLHLHGNGRNIGLEPNYVAWALACVWRGIRLPYALYGIVVVTGPDAGGRYTGLDQNLIRNAEHAAQATRNLHGQPVDQLLTAVGAYGT